MFESHSRSCIQSYIFFFFRNLVTGPKWHKGGKGDFKKEPCVTRDSPNRTNWLSSQNLHLQFKINQKSDKFFHPSNLTTLKLSKTNLICHSHFPYLQNHPSFHSSINFCRKWHWILHFCKQEDWRCLFLKEQFEASNKSLFVLLRFLTSIRSICVLILFNRTQFRSINNFLFEWTTVFVNKKKSIYWDFFSVNNVWMGLIIIEGKGLNENDE